MPSTKRRMALTLDDDLADLLDRFAKTTGTAKASFVVEMIRESQPVIEGIIKAVEMAKKNPAKTLDNLSDLLMANMVTAQQMRLDIEKDRKRLTKTKNLGSKKKSDT